MRTCRHGVGFKPNQRGIPVAIIEKNKKSKLSNINDLRTSAISQGSSRILTNLNIWNKIGNEHN